TNVVDLFAKIPEQFIFYFLIFLRFLNEFTSSLEKLENKNTDLQRGPWNFHKTPWKPKTNRAGVPGRRRGQRRRRRPFPGEEEARRRRGWRPGVRAHRDLPR